MNGIPQDLMACPVLISLEENGSGTGTLISFSKRLILTTARHVLFNDSYNLISNKIIVSCFTNGGTTDKPEILEICMNEVKYEFSKNADVAIVFIGRTSYIPEKGFQDIDYEKGIEILQEVDGLLIGAWEDSVIGIEDVIISGEIYVLGFPTSIGIKTSMQFDITRPLLRRGIVSNINKTVNTIVLDCAVYPGNSGGPVLQRIRKNGIDKFFLIGIISQYIPYEQKWINVRDKISHIEYHNSGYSIAVSINPVMDLINSALKI